MSWREEFWGYWPVDEHDFEAEYERLLEMGDLENDMYFDEAVMEDDD